MTFDRRRDKSWQDHEMKYNSKPIYSGYPIAKRSQEFMKEVTDELYIFVK